jgi:hypothetical protein
MVLRDQFALVVISPIEPLVVRLGVGDLCDTNRQTFFLAAQTQPVGGVLDAGVLKGHVRGKWLAVEDEHGYASGVDLGVS